MARNSMELLENKWSEGKHVCVGLDKGDLNEMTRVYGLTREVAATYKPNLAFWLAKGGKGVNDLKSLIGFIQNSSPDIPVILDCKDADIDSTNDEYVAMIEYLGADAITTNPYLGQEAIKPFLSRKDMGVFVLCHTSNKGAGEFQHLVVGRNAFGDVKLYEHVAIQVQNHWNANGNCGLVFGATFPQQLAGIRQYCPAIPLLIPGIGAQGGDLEATVKAAASRFIINSSRGIINAKDPRAEAVKLHDSITHILKGARHESAGNIPAVCP